MDVIKIDLKDVSINFKVYNTEKRIFKRYILDKIFKKKKNDLTNINAIQNINLSLVAGDRLGIIGKNGSGKTTLLRVMSGIYEPNRGTINIQGKIKNVLEVNSSGQMEDTVENNILLIGLLHGYKKEEILKKKEEIINFSGLRDFLKLPLISCSTGMQLRLLFSTLYHFDSDIYIIDEFISTGDKEFQEKGLSLIKKYTSNKILVFASHDLNLIKKECNKLTILDHGKQIYYGDVEKGISLYETL